MTPLELLLLGGIVGLIVAMLMLGSRQQSPDIYLPPVYEREPRGCAGEVIVVVVFILVLLALIASGI